MKSIAKLNPTKMLPFKDEGLDMFQNTKNIWAKQMQMTISVLRSNYFLVDDI